MNEFHHELIFGFGRLFARLLWYLISNDKHTKKVVCQFTVQYKGILSLWLTIFQYRYPFPIQNNVLGRYLFICSVKIVKGVLKKSLIVFSSSRLEKMSYTGLQIYFDGSMWYVIPVSILIIKTPLSKGTSEIYWRIFWTQS